MDPGKLNKRIKIKEPSPKKDSDGFKTKSEPKVIFTTWAAAYPLKGKEFWNAKTTHSKKVMKFICRYRKGVDEDMIVEYKDVDYEIIDVINVDEANKYLQILAEKVM